MGDLYSELLVKKEKTGKDTGLRVLVIGAAVVCFLIGFFYSMYFLIPAVLLGAGSYFVYQRTDLEFEYLYVNGDLDIDKIMAKVKRKKGESLNMSQTEIVAPVGSHRLDSYKRGSVQVKDYSSGNPSHKRYAVIYRGDGQTREIIIEPDEDLIQKMKYSAPGKVFFD
ncbi:hypothetical protein B5F53_09415 [Blautia sp. An249]|uniref:DUF6106 family protein n=1 Tax=Blautia sp. An249 TaxID=1965603 RepID=UPI000B3A34C2|nr:DUF6106 family protein [Blautia sp. An249]OUO78885.1 hypothetical protein B5F53_09415 [Blautia sp. An249]